MSDPKDKTGTRKYEDLRDLINPLRRNIDYHSIDRKTFLVEPLGFKCMKCGFRDSDKDYKHSSDECSVFEVLLS